MMSSFWSGWVIILTLGCLAFVIYFLATQWKAQRAETTTDTTGHAYDGIQELDNPMPKWWLAMFVATLIFTAFYLWLYPGLGNWKGFLGWTQVNELERHQEKHAHKYAPLFEQYANTPIDELIANPKAVKMGERIFVNNCALCHGSDAGGAFGFPNLRDGDWLYGGSADAISHTILEGRSGQMPAWGAVIGDEGVRNVSIFIRSNAGLDQNADPAAVAAGKKVYDTTCMACHGMNAEGNQMLGAPNLVDDIWLYGSSQAQIEYTVRQGRNGVMPAWKDILGKEKVHLAATYVYSLGKNESK